MLPDPLALPGIARVSTAIERGWTRHRIMREVSAGDLIRPRKGWIARPSADPALISAARHGVLLTCITQAERLGLWVGHPHPHHLAARRTGSEVRPQGALLHWLRPLLPRAPDALEDPIENVLDHVAHCRPFEEAVAIWDSALNKGAVQHDLLARLPLRGPSRSVLAAANRFTDSGLESYLRLRLSWMRIPLVAQAWILGHRVDFLLGERLILQIDGGHHVGAQRTKDIRHDAELSLRGYTVIRVGYEQVMDRWPEVQTLVMQAIAQGLHRRERHPGPALRNTPSRHR